MRFISIAVFILSLTVTLPAQTKKFRWTTELCEFEGVYDAGKYTEAQLRDTQKLLFSAGRIPLSINVIVWNYEDIKNLSLAKLDREYKREIEKLKNLDIVRSAYWEKLRRDKIKETEQFYRLSKTTIQAYTKPSVLKQSARAKNCVRKYADPLIKGGDELLNAWREVNEASRGRNADPERVRRIFEQKYASPDRFEHARLEVMTFGWWNCANETIAYVVSDEEQYKKFHDLFENVNTISCDEP